MGKNLLQVKRLLFTLIVLAFSTSYLHAQVAINEDGSAPENSAMLDVKSSDKGLLIPRLTTAARTTLGATAVEGLMVWDTDLNKFFFFNGVTWDEGSTGGLWTRSGSYTYLSNSGDKVGIGTTFPGYNLDVRSSTGSAFLRVKSTFGYAGIIINKASESSNAYIIYRLGGEFNKGWYVGMINNNDFTISRNSITSDGTFYIDSISGNIGIGTIDPQRGLEVKGGERTARINSSTNAAYLEFLGTNATDWAIGTETGSMRMQSSADGFATSTDRYIFSSSFFHPYSNNVRSLGLSSFRWSNLYSVDGDFSENVTIGDTLRVTGKAGIGIDTPARTLEVRGPWKTARISSTASGATLEFVSTTQDDWAVTTWAGKMYFLHSTDDFASKTDMYIYSTAGFYPVANNARILGASSNRWSVLYSAVGNFSNAGSGIAGATVYSVNTGTAGIAGYFESNGTDAAMVIKQNGTGKFLKAFGPNGGNEELSINNDGTISIYNSNYTRTILIDPSESGTTDGGQITMYNATGTATIEIDGSYGGDGRITTQELQITGGSDLSEFFDLTAYEDIQKGMVVSIDENNPGHLVVSKDAYDKKVAGIISGANNIEPGLIMSQKGTIADGEHLVALSGRVYCMVDASSNPVMIGDMLTTSSQPGHAMKVDDFEKARGAIIGKAMTSLESGKGLVLVLVSLQ